LPLANLPDKTLEELREDLFKDPFIDRFVEEGKQQGLEQGLEQGRRLGEADAATRLLLTILAARGIAIPEQTRARIAECADPDQLESWATRAATSTTADEVFASSAVAARHGSARANLQQIRSVQVPQCGE
jgi:hypothetical protein